MNSNLVGTQTFEQVEAFLLKQGLLCLHTDVVLNAVEGKEVLWFLQNNNLFDTFFATTNERQIYRSKRRSIGDIFLTLRYYFPTITLQEVHRQLNNSDGEGFGGQICPDINKRVWRTSYGDISHIGWDEFGFTYTTNRAMEHNGNYLKFIDVKG